MRYVVTGSAGFIGRHVCTELLQRGFDVVGIDAFTDYYDTSLKRQNAEKLIAHENYDGIDQDLIAADLAELFDGADAVIHLAGQPGVRMSWSAYFHVYVERNITASQKVLDAVHCTGVPRLVLASSSSVYGNALSYPTTENSPTRPYSAYGVTKLAMEHLAGAYAENWEVPVVALRYFTVYGPGQRPDMAMHSFIAHAAAGEAVVLYGDGEQIRDFTYVSDAAAATIAATTADVPPASVFNVAGGSSSTVNNVLRLVSEALDRELVVRQLPAHPGEVRVTGGAIDRAKRALGWEPVVALEGGIKQQVVHQIGQ